MPRYRDTQPAQQLACLRLGLPAIQPTETQPPDPPPRMPSDSSKSGFK